MFPFWIIVGTWIVQTDVLHGFSSVSTGKYRDHILIIRSWERCYDIKQQNIVSEISDEVALVFYQDMDYIWDREVYTECCTRSKEIGQLGLKVEIYKIWRIVTGIDIGNCCLCWGNENVEHVALNCPKTRKWSMTCCIKNGGDCAPWQPDFKGWAVPSTL